MRSPESTMLHEASPADIPALVEVINRAYRVESSFVIGGRTSEADVREKMAVPDSAFLLPSPSSGWGRGLAVDDAPDDSRRLAGAVYVQVHGDRGHFGPLAVDPECQGRGLGKMLVAAAESYCRDRGCAWLDLDVVNLREDLPAFYESLGFAVTGVAPFPKPERLRREAHLVIMTKRIE